MKCKIVIQVPRPDDVADKLGLIALDEPCAKQSDPTVLDLQLRAISKETTFKSVVCIQNVQYSIMNFESNFVFNTYGLSLKLLPFREHLQTPCSPFHLIAYFRPL